MGNDTQNYNFEIPLITRILDSMEKPAALLKIIDDEIEIAIKNDEFLELEKSTFHNTTCVNLMAFYGSEEEYSKIIKSVEEAANQKTDNESKIFLNLEVPYKTSRSFCVKNSFLHAQDGITYVLHMLNPLEDEKQMKISAEIKSFKKDNAREKALQNQILIQSEKRFRALVHDGSDMIAILDDKADYLYVSASSKSVLDIEPEIFIGLNAFQFIHPDDIVKAQAEFSAVAGKKKISLSPFRFRHNNGSWRWIQTVVTDLRHASAVGGFVANSRDVTDLVEAQMAIQLSNERYHYAGRATSDAVWDSDIASGTIFWGEGYLKLFGYNEAMISSSQETWENRIHKNDVERVKQKLNLFMSSMDTNWTDDYRFLKADGTYAYVTDKGFVIRDVLGKPIRMIGAMQDVTLRKKEDTRLRILESVVTNTIDAVLVAEISPSEDYITKIIFVNSAFEQMTGYSLNEVEGKSPWFLQGNNSDLNELKKLMDCIKNNKPYTGTIINYRKNGSQFWVSYSVTPVMDHKGQYAHWVAILRDVTDFKNQERGTNLLAEITNVFNNEKSFKETADKVLHKICKYGDFDFTSLWTLDPNRNKLEPTAECYLNQDTKQSFTKSLGSDFIKQYVLQIQKSETEAFWDISEEMEDVAGIKNIKTLFAFPLYHRHNLFGVLFIASTKKQDEKLNALPSLLAKHLGTELHRKKLEQELDQIFRLAPDVIAITDFQGNFKKLNPAASRLLGYSMEEMLTRPFSDFLHPDDKEETLMRLKNFRESGESYYIEERYITSCGRSKWLAWTSQPLHHDKLIYSVAKDITDKKELEELLLNSNSLARIGSWEISYPEKNISWSAITREILNVSANFTPEWPHPLGVFYPDDVANMMNARMEDSIENGTSWDEVLQIKTVSGAVKWIRSMGSAEMIQGKCIRLYGSLQDIDVQKRTEISATQARAQLEASEKRYSELFHLSPLPMWVYDFDTLDFLDVNETAVKHYGYSRKDFLKMNIRDIRPETEIEKLDSVLKQTRKQKSKMFKGSFKHRKKNGDLIDVDIKSNTIIFKGKRAKLIVATDISERIEYFNAIEKRNEILREIAWIQSHKVRAPLAKIMGLVSLLSTKESSDKEMAKILKFIDSSANELDGVIREVTIKSEDLAKYK